MGEIDLVMLDRSKVHKKILVFVEVRFRSRQDFGGAAASVTLVKQRRIIRTAQWFRQNQPTYQNLPCRFDVIAISGTAKAFNIKWLSSAFDG